MIDNFSLAVSHGLMLLAVWLLLRRPDLDREGGTRAPGAGAARRGDTAPSRPADQGDA